MGTHYSEIYELFLASVQDYRIDKIFRKSKKSAEAYMKPFLIRGLINFYNCKNNLEDRDDVAQTFGTTLSTEEKVILGNLMAVSWMEKNTNDILEMRNHLQDQDFRMYSSAQNLKEKSTHLAAMRETVSQQITQYGYNNLDWTKL